MPCVLTTGFTLDCRDAVGGLKSVYFIEIDNISSFTESSGTITAITKVATKVFRKYELVLDTANFEEKLTGDRKAGTIFYAQTLQIILNKLRVAVRNEIKLLAQNRLVAVVETMEGSFFLLGKAQGLMLNAATAGSGTAMSDRNGYQLDFDGQEVDQMFAVSSGIITGLTA